MKLSQLLETSYYDKEHECKTPGAVYTIEYSGKTISISVKLPTTPDLTSDEMDKIEAKLHYAVENVLSELFDKSGNIKR